MSKYPLARNNVSYRRTGYKIPGPILLEGGEFVNHDIIPMRIIQRTAVTLRNWTEDISKKIEAINNRLRHAMFATRVHCMSVISERRADRSQDHMRGRRRRLGGVGGVGGLS